VLESSDPAICRLLPEATSPARWSKVAGGRESLQLEYIPSRFHSLHSFVVIASQARPSNDADTLHNTTLKSSISRHHPSFTLLPY
jgi:hypothetical protein